MITRDIIVKLDGIEKPFLDRKINNYKGVQDLNHSYFDLKNCLVTSKEVKDDKIIYTIHVSNENIIESDT